MACSRVNFYFNFSWVLQSLNLLLKIIKLKQRITCQFPVLIILVNCLLLMWKLLCTSPCFGSGKLGWCLSSENVWKAKFLERYFKSKFASQWASGLVVGLLPCEPLNFIFVLTFPASALHKFKLDISQKGWQWQLSMNNYWSYHCHVIPAGLLWLVHTQSIEMVPFSNIFNGFHSILNNAKC